MYVNYVEYIGYRWILHIRCIQALINEEKFVKDCSCDEEFFVNTEIFLVFGPILNE